MDSTMQLLVFFSIVIISVFVGFIISSALINNKNKKAGIKAESIIENAVNEAEKRRKETLVETKEEIQQLKRDADKELKEKKQEYLVFEEKILKREESIDKRETNIQNRENTLTSKEEDLKKQQQKIIELENQIEKKIEEQNNKLHEISKLSFEDARKIILDRVENSISKEVAVYIREQEEEAKLVSDKKAKELLANSIQKYASDVTNEITVTTVGIPSEDIKGRIIGREGRNIRTFEALTGVDLIIDDTPDVVVLSGFDPIRRETARLALEKLIKEGRINPTRIEEVVRSVQKEMDTFIISKGEETIFELGLGKVHHEIVRLIGRLHFRTSYGQNALQHSKEVAFLSGLLAAEMDQDEVLAKRAGLLHDIGKALDHETEGSHVELGLEVAKRYKEHSTVINAIGSHHGNVEATSVISVLVAAADALSAARPGARSDSLENYVKRLEQLEELTSSFEGVETAYALQAGREVRIVVNPSEVDDDKTYLLAREIKESIENNLQYPGTIKVVVIRETRADEEAK